MQRPRKLFPSAVNSLVLGFLLVVTAFLPLAYGVNGQSAATCVKYPGNPVLVSGVDNTWDNTGIGYPSVLRNGSSFVMFYGGTRNNVTNAIGLATSTDGVTGRSISRPSSSQG